MSLVSPRGLRHLALQALLEEPGPLPLQLDAEVDDHGEVRAYVCSNVLSNGWLIFGEL